MSRADALSPNWPGLLPGQRRALAAAGMVALGMHALLLLGWPTFDAKVRAGAAHGSFATRMIAAAPAAPAAVPAPQPAPTPAPPVEQVEPAPKPRPTPKRRQATAQARPPTDAAAPQHTARGASGGSDSPFASLFDPAPTAAFGGTRPDVPAKPSLEAASAQQALEFASAQEEQPATVPRGATLAYRVTGSLAGQAVDELTTLAWRRAPTYYEADWDWRNAERSNVRLGSIGLITEQGQLLPVLSGARTGGATPARFDYADRTVHFPDTESTAPFQPGTQDALSAIVQLGAWLAGDRSRFAVGQAFTLPVADDGSVQSWRWLVEPETSVTALGGKELPAVKLTHLPVDDTTGRRPRIELWLSPSLDYLPARMRLAWPNGDTLDQVASSARLNRVPEPARAPQPAASQP